MCQPSVIPDAVRNRIVLHEVMNETARIGSVVAIALAHALGLRTEVLIERLPRCGVDGKDKARTPTLIVRVVAGAPWPRLTPSHRCDPGPRGQSLLPAKIEPAT